MKTWIALALALGTFFFGNVGLEAADVNAQEEKITINLASRILTFWRNGKKVIMYPIAVGAPESQTPIGSFSVLEMEENPEWIDPKDTKQKVPSGETNPLGYRWMRFYQTYGIHGTNRPSSIGEYVSNGDDYSRSLERQTTNQIITFRTKNPWDGTPYYAADSSSAVYASSKLSSIQSNVELPPSTPGMTMYPYLVKKDGLKMSFKDTSKYILMNNEDDIVIPVKVSYNFTGDTSSSQYQKTMSFDVRTSLYSDPLTYTFVVEVPKSDKVDDKLVSSLTKQFNNKKLKNRKYLTIVK